MTKMTTPQRKTMTIAAVASELNSAKLRCTSTMKASEPMTVGISFQSASRPPMRLPTVMPAPKSSSTQVTVPTASPVTSVRIGAI